MEIGSHNSWSYLPPRKWWMRLLNFSAKCQDVNIVEQYKLGVRAFDLRIRFIGRDLVVVHNKIEYQYNLIKLLNDLGRLNHYALDNLQPVSVRVIHDCRSKSQYEQSSIDCFKDFCRHIESNYPCLMFFGGNNFYSGECEYNFGNSFSQEGAYASANPPLLDDIFPWLYAAMHNADSRKVGTEKDILWLDFVNV